MLVADNENNGRKEVMTLEANLMTFPDRRLLHPLPLYANNYNNGGDPSRPTPGRYGATLATRIK